MSRMNPLIDGRVDRDFTLLARLHATCGLPDYVKQADQDETLAPRDLPSSAYADPDTPQLPIHTKSACYMSYLYFLANEHLLAPAARTKIAAALDQAAVSRLIADDVRQARRAYLNAGQCDASTYADDCFALVKVAADGSKIREYPIHNALATEKAANWLVEHRRHLDFPTRSTMANRVLDKIDSLYANVSDPVYNMLTKMACREPGDPQRVSTQIHLRRSLKPMTKEAAQLYEDLAAGVLAQPFAALDPEMSQQIAQSVNDLDAFTGIDKLYDKSVVPIEEVMFGHASKAAEFTDKECQLANGAVFEIDQLGYLSLHDVNEMFGRDTANKVASRLQVNPIKMASVATSLSRRQADDLMSMLKRSGQEPSRVKQSDWSTSEADRRLLADIYATQPPAEDDFVPTGISGSREISPARP